MNCLAPNHTILASFTSYFIEGHPNENIASGSKSHTSPNDNFVKGIHIEAKGKIVSFASLEAKDKVESSSACQDCKIISTYCRRLKEKHDKLQDIIASLEKASITPLAMQSKASTSKIIGAPLASMYLTCHPLGKAALEKQIPS
nr:hypothetical protein CFP56_17920 [Quercus suber]